MVVQRKWSEIAKQRNKFLAGARWGYWIFCTSELSFYQDLFAGLVEKSDDIGNLKMLLCAALCNSNRYGKDKTVVIAMGRGKRQKRFTPRSQRGFRGIRTNCRMREEEKSSNMEKKEFPTLCLLREYGKSNNPSPKTPCREHKGIAEISSW